MEKHVSVSIVIPTYNHLEDCLKPCIENIKKYTNLDAVEVIIVANGCTDGTHEFLDTLDKNTFKSLWFANAVGYAKATNAGLEVAQGDYIICLNNDAMLMEQHPSQWISMLIDPMVKDEAVGITGPLTKYSPETREDFVIFFCAMIKREVIQKIGLLDEGFIIGGAEDIDFCARATRAGYKVVRCVKESKYDPNVGLHVSEFPIFHRGEATVNDNPKWQEIFDANIELLRKKYEHEIVGGLDVVHHVPDVQIDTTDKLHSWIGKDTDMSKFLREEARYKWAVDKIKTKWQHYIDTGLEKVRVLDIGCSTGYGSQYMPEWVEYYGIDKSEDAIEWARKEFGDKGTFNVADITAYGLDGKFEMSKHDVILAFEVLEHFDEGLSYAQMLKEHCEQLLVTVPYKENPGNWGPDHVMHKLTEKDFPGFYYEYLIHDNIRSDRPCRFDGYDALCMEWREELRNEYPPYETVLAFVATKDRYTSTLPLTLTAIALQTRRPDNVLIWDDSTNRINMLENPTYQYIFQLFYERGIEWEILFAPGKGQHHGHQWANTRGFDFVWRVDDDEVPQATVLDDLMYRMWAYPELGAVGGRVLEPGKAMIHKPHYVLNKLSEIHRQPNMQWFKDCGTALVDHLYSSFLYRAGVANYDLNLSKVAHREETIFTQEIQQAGYKLLVDDEVTTWHFRNPEGGIRSGSSEEDFKHDEEIFMQWMKKWGIVFVVLDCGVGDHYAFKHILPEIKKHAKEVVLAVCYPGIFPDEHIISITDATNMGLDGNKYSVYVWMQNNNWKHSIVEAYRKMYSEMYGWRL